MLPYFCGMDMYHVMINIGTILGILAFVWCYYRKVPSVKLLLVNLFFCFLLLMGGVKGAQALRMLNSAQEQGGLKTFAEIFTDPAGSHFLGRILVAVILYLLGWQVLDKIWGKNRKNIWGAQGKDLKQAGLDALCIYFVIQHFFNRLGCLCRGCCYGKPYQGLLAVRYQGGIPLEKGITYQVFPSQLLEAVLMLLLFIWMIWLYKKGKSLGGRFLTGFASCILISEFFMDQEGIRLFLGMNVIQWTAVITMLLGMFLWHFRDPGEKYIAPKGRGGKK